jgi:glycogen(starch) synthase
MTSPARQDEQGRQGPAVLSISLDSQIATAGGARLGDTADRQRRYAARLAALHVVVKTRRGAAPARVELAPNAWAYPTNSRSRYAFVPDAYRLAARTCARERVDVVSAQDPFATGLAAWLAATRYRKPLNVQLHFDVLDNPYWVREKREHRPLNLLGKWLVRRADSVRVGTTAEKRKLATWGIDPRDIFVAPVPVDLARFIAARPDPRVRAGFAEGAPLVLNASRLVAQKNLAALLEAVARVRATVPGVRLALAGDGPLADDLRALAARLGIAERVRFLGRVDHGEMPGVLAAAAVVAVSSVYEGTSLVTVEAAAAGKPVVTTDVAGASDTVVEGQTGFVRPVGDVAALAAALAAVLSDPRRAAAMGAAAREHVRRRFDYEATVSGVVEMWAATADRRRR